MLFLGISNLQGTRISYWEMGEAAGQVPGASKGEERRQGVEGESGNSKELSKW